jgi:CheY-like chemotaxis protein/HPt (histidine-containing phosphotransfer) domain-containing protein
MLKDFDIQTNTACDGIEAVTAARQFSFDVILMDVRMPEMDGLQATRELRNCGEKPFFVPIIAFTANAFPEDIAACREAGMNDFVVKPARKKAMVEAILRVLPKPARAIDALVQRPSPDLAPMQLASAESSCPVARKSFDELVTELGAEAASEIFDVFVRETEARLGLLSNLSVDFDRAGIEREAHSLKSGAATFGLGDLSALARNLERDAAVMTDADYRQAVGRMLSAYSLVKQHSLWAEMTTTGRK